MSAPPSTVDEPARKRSWLVVLPLVLFAALAVLLWLRLYAGDASRLPSPLIGKPMPAFALGPVAGLDRPGLATADLRRGDVTLVNVFASWCVPCRAEAPSLLALAQTGVRLVGIAYKDKADDTRLFLEQSGDPFAAVGSDANGRTGIDLGVYGVPETYVVNGAGTVVAKVVGPLTDEVVKSELQPALALARR